VAKEKCNEIIEVLEHLEEMKFNEDTLDEALLRAFICERFYKKAEEAEEALAADFFDVDKVDPFAYIIGWAIAAGCWTFCLYWTFAWGIKNGEQMLITWASDFR